MRYNPGRKDSSLRLPWSLKTHVERALEKGERKERETEKGERKERGREKGERKRKKRREEERKEKERELKRRRVKMVVEKTVGPAADVLTSVGIVLSKFMNAYVKKTLN